MDVRSGVFSIKIEEEQSSEDNLNEIGNTEI